MTTIEDRHALRVLRSDSPGWDDARRGWNLAVDQHPEAIVLAESAQDVVGAVDHARRNGLRVATQATGHACSCLGPLGGRFCSARGTCTGSRSTPPPGWRGSRAGHLARGRSSRSQVWVGAAGGIGSGRRSRRLPLGGGLSFLGRKYGLAAHAIVGADVVTADGRLLHADEDSNQELLWALRGGGGSFGAVTALEVGLFPVTEVYAGILWFPFERAPEVLHTWAGLTREGLPDELTTIGRLLQLPPIPAIPEQLGESRSRLSRRSIAADKPRRTSCLLPCVHSGRRRTR